MKQSNIKIITLAEWLKIVSKGFNMNRFAWNQMNKWKRACFKRLSDDDKIIAKQEIDDLFRQATGNKFMVHPAWWIC